MTLKKLILSCTMASILALSSHAFAQPTVEIKTNKGVIVVELNQEEARNLADVLNAAISLLKK